MSEIDLLELGSYTELQGGNIVLPDGYSAILDPVSKLISPENILKNHPVKTIRWCNHLNPDNADTDSDDSDRTVTDVVPRLQEPSLEIGDQSTNDNQQADDQKSNRNNLTVPQNRKKHRNNIEIICENGSKFSADHCICTIPLGVLKEKADSLFEPQLPEDKVEAIERLLFGTVDKIFLDYDRPFLNPDVSEIMLLWGNNFPCNECDISKNWYKKIYSFSKLSDTLLLGWISGKEAEYMETLSMEEISDRCTEILRKFLNDPFVPKPKKCVW